MANVNTVSFGTVAPDYQSQQLELQRRQQLADMLRKQSTEPIEQQTVSGRVVPIHPLQGVAKLAQAFFANRTQQDTDQKQRDLASEMTQNRASTLAEYLRAMEGTPAQPAETFAPGPDDMGPAGTRPEQPAEPGDRRKALAVLLRSPDASFQQIGMQMALKEQEPAKWSTTPHYDHQGNAFILNERGQKQYLPGVKARDKMENVNGVWQNPYAQEPNAIAPADPNKPFAIGPDGKPVANTAYQEYDLKKAKTGATNVSLKTEVKMNEGLANQVGPMMKDSATAATAAVQQVDAAQRIIKAIETGNVMAGPGATTQLKLAQIGQKIGIGGKDDEERILNTRQAIRGLSELTLQGRKEMRGEGAVTEQEGALAQKAMSGDIDDLTPAEIKIIAKASERFARWRYQEHNRKVEQMRKTPGLEGVTPFYEAPAMPAALEEMQPAVPTAPAGGGWSIRPK